METTVRRYFKVVPNLRTTYNIAYRNSTCARVSAEVRKSLLRKVEPYEVGDALVCRNYLQIEKQVFHACYE